MARTHLTLAALATAAVPGLDVTSARKHTGGGHGDFESAVVVDRDGSETIIRVPRSASAEADQSADLVALRALTTGVRGRLPFDVPEYLGQAPLGSTRAMAYRLLDGSPITLDDISASAGLAGSIGRTVAAIHALPTSVVADAGLPQFTAAESRSTTLSLIGRAADTGNLPAALLRRWEQATDDDGLWQFQPVVLNGSLSVSSLLVTDEAVTAVIGWGGLRVGDPARDMHWLVSAQGETSQTAIAAYASARGTGADRQLTQRSMLYAELELARWLLHGVDARDQSIVDDAVGMLDSLVDSVHGDVMNPISPATGPVLSVADVESLLAETPRSEIRRDPGGDLHTDSYDQSSFERGEYGDTGDESVWTAELGPAWVAEAAKAGTGPQDELPTGPIGLFEMPDQDDADDADSETPDHNSRNSSSS